MDKNSRTSVMLWHPEWCSEDYTCNNGMYHVPNIVVVCHLIDMVYPYHFLKTLF